MCNVDDVWLETTSLLFTLQEVVAGNTHKLESSAD